MVILGAATLRSGTVGHSISNTIRSTNSRSIAMAMCIGSSSRGIGHRITTEMTGDIATTTGY